MSAATRKGNTRSGAVVVRLLSIPMLLLTLPKCVHPNVVNQHGLRKYCRRVWTAGPVSADRHVEQNEKWMIESPFHPGCEIGTCPGFVENVVAVEANDIRFPFDREHMKRIRESLVVRERVRRAEAGAASVAWPMDRAVNKWAF